MWTMLIALLACWTAMLSGPASACAGQSGTNNPAGQPTIPYVATRHDAVRDMLWMADVGKNDVVYDLGSGDGRIVIAAARDFGARKAVGIEIDPQRIRESRQNAEQAGVADRVEFIQGDLFTNDFREASVLVLYLGHEPNITLRPRLLRLLKPGARVVSHEFGMGEWQPDKTLTLRTVFLGMWGERGNPFKTNPRVPDYAGNDRAYGRDTMCMWVVPAPVAGVWRGTVPTAQGEQDLKLVLHQRLSEVNGSFQLSTQTNLEGRVRTDLWGSHLRFECRPSGMPYGAFLLKFDGHIHENTVRGTLAVFENKETRELQWEARRDQVDFTGIWEWPCPTGSRAVRLQITRLDGQYAANYADGGKTIPVTDFYDFGGGFYFTLLIGRERGGLRLDDDTGWLIGEGVAEDGVVRGTTEFYPYPRSPEGRGRPRLESSQRPQQAVQEGPREWRPDLVKP